MSADDQLTLCIVAILLVAVGCLLVAWRTVKAYDRVRQEANQWRSRAYRAEQAHSYAYPRRQGYDPGRTQVIPAVRTDQDAT